RTDHAHTSIRRGPHVMNPAITRHAALFALALALLSACARDAPPVAGSAGPPATVTDAPAAATPPEDADLARARAAAQAFSGQLRGRLQGAMQQGGPLAAVEVCHDQARRIAEAVMAEHGLRLGRVALPGRNRNPAHAADDWRLQTLQVFQQAVESGADAGDQVAVLREGLPDGVALRMMRGIATEPGCLACHGADVAPAVRAAIAARYPGDGATGFEPGDLRGALWVEVPSAAR